MSKYKRRFGDRTSQRVAAVRRAMSTDFQVRGDIRSGQHSANREATAQRLGAGQNVRRHAAVHIRIQLAAAAGTGLHFVKN